MKKSFVVASLTAASLALAACGGATTTENSTVVTNEVVLDEGVDANLTAVDALNSADVVGNAVDATLTTTETTTTTVTNAH